MINICLMDKGQEKRRLYLNFNYHRNRYYNFWGQSVNNLALRHLQLEQIHKLI